MPSPAPRSTGLWILVGILLVLAAVPPLCVGFYDQVTPRFAGFPFYYWAQFAMVVFAAICTSIAYAVSKRATRRDRAARGRGEVRG